MTKTKKGKHLRFYINCMINNEMPHTGLCSCGDNRFIDSEMLHQYFTPNDEENELLNQQNVSRMYWGSDSENFKLSMFTTLRQTIVLFMAAIKNEL